MTVTLGTRTSAPQWSSGTDPFTRAQMNAANAAIENSMAIDTQGTLAARPAAGKRGRYYYCTDTGQFFRDTGAVWVQLPTLGTANVFTAAQSILADGSSDQLKLDTSAASGSATLLVRRRTAADLSTWKQSQLTVSANRMALMAQANTDAGNSYANDLTGMSGRWALNWNADTVPTDTLVIKTRLGTELARFVESGGLSVGAGSSPVASLDVRTQSAGATGLRVGGPVANGHEWAYLVIPTEASSVQHLSGVQNVGGVYYPKNGTATIYEQYRDFHHWYADTNINLTPGSTYTPTLRMKLARGGELFVKELWVGDSNTWGFMGLRQRAGTTGMEIVNSGGANSYPYVSFARSDGGFNEAVRVDIANGWLRVGDSVDMSYGQRGVIGLSNIGAAFVGNPVSGGYLYAVNGGLAWRGSAGTITNLAPP